nr:MAG TPA_asm: acyltransferase family protein [Caudoviricetes sp.]
MRERVNFIDACKVLAILLVVETHARELSGVVLNDYKITSLLYSIDRIGVVLFFCCSGYLVFTYGAGNFSKIFKRVILLSLSLSVFSVITNAVYSWTHGSSIYDATATAIKYNNIIIRNDIWKAIHLWFIKAFIPVFVIGSMLVKAKIMDKPTWHLPIALFIFGYMSHLVVYYFPESYFSILDLGPIFSYLFLFVSGYYLFNVWKEKALSANLAGVISISCILITWLLQCSNEETWRLYRSYATSPSLAISGIFLFVFFSQYNKEIKFFKAISNHSFGIYLTHYPVMLMVTSYFSKIGINGYMLAAVSLAISFPAALLATSTIKKTPLRN